MSASGGAVVGLTNGYIHNVLKNELRLETFSDVYSADTLPHALLRSKQTILCVVNTSSLNEPGTHFITILVRPKSILVLDSLSLPLREASPELHSRLRQSRKTVQHAFSQPIQSVTSAFCGIYCIYFCVYLSKKQFPLGRSPPPVFEYGEGDNNDRAALSSLLRLISANKRQTRVHV